jgi:hypothetical protein
LNTPSVMPDFTRSSSYSLRLKAPSDWLIASPKA